MTQPPPPSATAEDIRALFARLQARASLQGITLRPLPPGMTRCLATCKPFA
jgi:hypothetical protein